MPDLEQQILDYLTRPGVGSVKAAGLAKKLKIAKGRRRQFHAALDSLIAEGRVRENRRGQLRARAAPGTVVGIIRRTRSGAGFVIPHEAHAAVPTGEVFVSERDIHDAHTGDEVLVRLLGRRRAGGQRYGRVEAVVERARSTFVGTYFEEAGEGFVEIDGGKFTEPVTVGDPGAKGARPGEKVVVEMLRFPTHYLPGEAVLSEVLGPRGEPGVDELTVIHEFGLPLEFPDEALEEARIEAEHFDESDLNGRLDLTGETVVTIDPADARDFDDAISLTREETGHWRLGVHIADVSRFVRPGTTLDGEARRRGNSVYLPGRVLPMLPEVLSNGLASLQQGKLRFTKSVFIEFTAEGVPVHTQFANSAIKVTRRFTYEEVLPIIQEPQRFRTRVGAKVRSLLGRMHELAMVLRRRRFATGSLELTLPEVAIDFDEEGRVSGAHEEQHDESHQIIEEFMLAANMAVAGALAEKGVPFLRRVHGDPSERKLRQFAEFAAALGYPLRRYQSRSDLQELLNRVRETPAEHAIHYALLRSLKQAEYSPVDLGHYALAVEDYCHFTSPIRRYPDLAVHRLVDERLIEGRGPGSRRSRKSQRSQDQFHRPSRGGGSGDELELMKLGTHCSVTERRADQAERELNRIKLLRWISERVGEELEAVVTGVERFGLFCRGVDVPVEGLVPIATLDPDEYFDYDQMTHTLLGRRRGRQFRLGDRVRVKVAHVDIDRRELDFQIVAAESGRAAGRGRPRGERGRKKKTKKKQSRIGRRRRR